MVHKVLKASKELKQDSQIIRNEEETGCLENSFIVHKK